MIQRSILWQAAGFAAVTFSGTILHFLYDWTGGSILAAPFSGVNESTWEHMKLLFWPLFLFALVQRLFFNDQENYWCVKLAEILLGLALIPVLFYTYNGVFGKSPDWINIAIFYVTATLVFLFERWAFENDRLQCRHPQLAFATICLIGVLFVVFTFTPPQIPLFRDPLTDTHGIEHLFSFLCLLCDETLHFPPSRPKTTQPHHGSHRCFFTPICDSDRCEKIGVNNVKKDLQFSYFQGNITKTFWRCAYENHSRSIKNLY